MSETKGPGEELGAVGCTACAEAEERLARCCEGSACECGPECDCPGGCGCAR